MASARDSVFHCYGCLKLFQCVEILTCTLHNSLHTWRPRWNIIKRSMCLTSRVGLISKWLPHWIYYVINVYSSCEEARFTFPKLYQVFLSLANALEIGNTCWSIARAQNISTSKTQNSFSSFLLSCQNLCYMITTWSNKLLAPVFNEITALTSVQEDDWSTFLYIATYEQTLS